MKRFSFRLAPVLELRKRTEDAVKLELAKKNQQILDAKQELASLHGELVALQTEEKGRRSRNANIQALRASVSYRFRLKEDILKTGNKVEDLNHDALVIQGSLVKAVQARRAIELVRESRYRDWKKDAQREGQAFTDEVSQQGFIRRKHAAARHTDVTPEQ